MKKSVYLDNAAATPLDPKVLQVMLPFLKSEYGNPSALYTLALQSKSALEQSRKQIGKIINSTSDTITFVSGGTESDNLAIFGIARAHQKSGKHIVTTAIEHEAVLNPFHKLSEEGFDITYIKPDKNGIILASQLLNAIRKDTILVSTMYANNEIGTILPISEIGRGILKSRKTYQTAYPIFHTDACQAAGYLSLNVEELHVDLLSLNASKIYGPKGAGLLYIRRGVKLEPILYGGSQESKIRPGTENVASIVGLAEALNLTNKIKAKEVRRLAAIQKYALNKITKTFPDLTLNGPELGPDRLPNNLNLVFPKVDAETLLLYLNEQGIACATGSACTQVSATPSHVLTALGLEPSIISSSLRFSLGRKTSKTDIDYLVLSLAKAIKIIKNKG